MMSRLKTALFRELGMTVLWRLRSTALQETGTDELRADLTHSDAKNDQPSSPPRQLVEDAADSAKTALAPSGGRGTRPRIAWPGDAPANRHSGAVPVEVRSTETASAGPASTEVSQSHDAQDSRHRHIAKLDWEALEGEIRQCTACRLCDNRRQAVPGVGDRSARWMFVGEGPGAEEDRKGEPFVGPAGKLLDKMLASIGLARGQQVYIANAVKCRPPSNRTPNQDEIAQCRSYLDRQIALIQPSLIVALGRPAALALLKTDVKINEVRGRTFNRDGIPIIVTYHPSYLLRNPADKGKAWQDLCFALGVMREHADRS